MSKRDGPCTDPECAAPGHGDGVKRPALRCKGCGKRIDNPLCHDCHGRIDAAVAETTAIIAIRDKRDALREHLDEATQLLVLLTPILRAWEHDSLFHNDLIGERERCEFCILSKRVAAFLAHFLAQEKK